MKEFIVQIGQIISGPHVAMALRAAGVLVTGILVTRLVQRYFERRGGAAHHTALLRRALSYAIMGMTVAWALRELGFQIGTLLGAAGVLTVALGFASQTAVSNIISGLFMLGEQPFKVGDLVTVGETSGEVLSIDLLSVKVRTYDNLMLRIPNETMLKSNVLTLTRFPIRRVDLLIGVAYKEDFEHVKTVLMRVADKNPLCLEEPKPNIIHQGFGASSVDLKFTVWGDRTNYLELRTGMYVAIKAAFDAEGIEIPFPHRTLYTGAVTDPFPVVTRNSESAVVDGIDGGDRP